MYSDIYFEIFKHIDDPTTFFNCSLVCKHFNHIFNNLSKIKKTQFSLCTSNYIIINFNGTFYDFIDYIPIYIQYIIYNNIRISLTTNIFSGIGSIILFETYMKLPNQKKHGIYKQYFNNDLIFSCRFSDDIFLHDSILYKHIFTI